MKMIRNILLMLTAVTLTGCGVEQRPSSDVKYFLLDVQRPGTEAAVMATTCLRIRPCRVTGSFAGRSLVYRTSTVLYEPDYYNLFLTNPDDQITDALRSWFRQSGFVDCVLGDETASKRCTLERRVDILCADFTDKENPTAVIQLHVLVTRLDKNCSCVKTVLEKTYSVKTVLPTTPTAAQVVEGLSSSLSQILQQLESDLANTLSLI